MARPAMNLFVSLYVACSTWSAPDVAAAAPGKPNVILVITDDQGYGDIGAHGNSMIRTPHLDRLHGESVRLTNFHVDPTCSPTRSALMSGRYSTRTGVWHTIMGRSLMRTEEVTLAEVLRAGGYRTGMFGKWHLGENYPLRPQDQGFDEVFCHGGGGVGQGPDYWDNDYFDDTYFRNGRPEKVSGYCTDVWFSNALDFIERHRDGGPFFAYISTNAPHGPLNVSERYSEPYIERGVPEDMAKFYGMIENIDDNMGVLMAKLKLWGLEENTILIFMTDNGTAAGRPRRNPKPGQWGGFNDNMRGAKSSEYEGGHRVPFFIRWPAAGLLGGRDVDQLTAHIDVVPTLADLCQVPRKSGPDLDGTSLVAILRGDRTALRERTLFVHSQRIPDPEKWRKCAVMTGRWRLINGRELYDLEADRAQTRDVAGEHPEVVAKLRAAYDGWWEGLSAVFDDSVHVGIGSEKETVTQLHPHDRQVTKQRLSSWHQSHVRRGHLGDGFWAIDVLRPGRYEFELRRWPAHLDRPIEASAARLEIGGVESKNKVSPDDRKTVFSVELQPGKTKLRTWLTLSDGKERGAYFVYVRYLGT
ncbi:MAG: arylsulfatase [Planctomycetota bacterium]|nr:arylsulfatase [Planctomycetota bacterium]